MATQAHQELAVAFPHGYATVVTPSHGYLCGLHALRLSIQQQYPHIPAPTLAQLQAIATALPTVGSKRNFAEAELLAILQRWATNNNHGEFTLGYIEGNNPTLLGYLTQNASVLWIHNNNARAAAKKAKKAKVLNHWSGMRHSDASSQIEEPDTAVSPIKQAKSTAAKVTAAAWQTKTDTSTATQPGVPTSRSDRPVRTRKATFKAQDLKQILATTKKVSIVKAQQKKTRATSTKRQADNEAANSISDALPPQQVATSITTVGHKSKYSCFEKDCSFGAQTLKDFNAHRRNDHKLKGALTAKSYAEKLTQTATAAIAQKQSRKRKDPPTAKAPEPKRIKTSTGHQTAPANPQSVPTAPKPLSKKEITAWVTQHTFTQAGPNKLKIVSRPQEIQRYGAQNSTRAAKSKVGTAPTNASQIAATPAAVSLLPTSTLAAANNAAAPTSTTQIDNRVPADDQPDADQTTAEPATANEPRITRAKARTGSTVPQPASSKITKRQTTSKKPNPPEKPSNLKGKSSGKGNQNGRGKTNKSDAFQGVSSPTIDANSHPSHPAAPQLAPARAKTSSAGKKKSQWVQSGLASVTRHIQQQAQQQAQQLADQQAQLQAQLRAQQQAQHAAQQQQDFLQQLRGAVVDDTAQYRPPLNPNQPVSRLAYGIRDTGDLPRPVAAVQPALARTQNHLSTLDNRRASVNGGSSSGSGLGQDPAPAPAAALDWLGQADLGGGDGEEEGEEEEAEGGEEEDEEGEAEAEEDGDSNATKDQQWVLRN